MSKKDEKRRSSTCLDAHTHTTKLTALSSKRSQAALEYMMSYGWAILIIVIVAAVLWSFGVFNPSSSSTGGTTGFAGLGSVIGVCYSNGTVSIQLGNSQGNSINITAINITSSKIVGQVVAYPNKVISPEGSIIYSVNSACPTTSGSSYSVKVYVTYKEVSSPFQAAYFSSGTLSGTVAGAVGSSLPPGVITSSALTIINTQTTGVSGPFQQMVNLSLSSIKSHINNTGTHSFQNVVFFNRSNDAIIKSWLENYSFSKNWALYWIVLPNGIPALSMIQEVAVGFASNNTDLFNKTNDGEAPQLSSTYGQYDDGKNIFSYYTNFSGTALSSGWTNSGITYTVNNGISATATAANGYISFGTSVTAPVILEAYGNIYEPNTNWVSIGVMTVPVINQAGYQGMTISTGFGSGYEPAGTYQGNQVEGSAHTTVGGSTASNSSQIWGVAYISTSSSAYFTGYSQIGATITTPTVSTPLYPAIFEAGANAVSYTFSQATNLRWFRIRNYPPNGVMPTALLGNLGQY